MFENPVLFLWRIYVIVGFTEKQNGSVIITLIGCFLVDFFTVIASFLSSTFLLCVLTLVTVTRALRLSAALCCRGKQIALFVFLSKQLEYPSGYIFHLMYSANYPAHSWLSFLCRAETHIKPL